jgi:hypothetical protein
MNPNMNTNSIDLDFIQILPPFEGERVAQKINKIIEEWNLKR